MERSAEEERRGEETYYLYSPCYLVEQLIKALYKCLGKDTQQADADTAPASEAETQMKATEEEYAMETTMTRALGVIKRPPRPPGSSGGGGQIN
ncbi:hypothetical protein AB3S75_002589 [Citrus x aurantiifolia]